MSEKTDKFRLDSNRLVSERLLEGTFASHVQYAYNDSGRDIVVGDIHGYFAELAKGLEAIGFDKKSDRLFALGDLVDKGPDSAAALEWLREPWFKSVIGNHDLSHALSCEREHISDFWILDMIVSSKVDWAKTCSSTIYKELVRELSRLPLAITLESTHGKVGLVHAELSSEFPTWGEFISGIENQKIDHNLLWFAVTQRRYDLRPVETRDESKHLVPDVAALFHGHSIPWFREPISIGNRYYIETGAYLKPIRDEGGFTLIDIEQPDKPLLSCWWPT